MGKMSKDKGARFERQVAGMFMDYGYLAQRTAQHCGKTGQAADIKGVPYLHIECKHQERMKLYEWMGQALRDSLQSEGRPIPTVIHKANNKPVLVTMLFDDWMKIYREFDAGERLKNV